MRFAIVFVCQAGQLEPRAVLLAASLRRVLPPDVTLIASVPIPEAEWGRPAPATLEVLRGLGVRLQERKNPIGPGYPIGNKLAALDVDVEADRVVFLDSDIVALEPIDLARHFAPDFAAKPADLATFGADEADWRRVYDLFGLPAPRRRVVATVSGDTMWPYFNAGVVGVRTDRSFAAVWTECCRVIDADEHIPKRRPHLDQIGLPVAVIRAGMDFAELPVELNFPLHLRPLPARGVALCHYHWPHVLLREPRLMAAIGALLAMHPGLAPVIAGHEGWAAVAGSRT